MRVARGERDGRDAEKRRSLIADWPGIDPLAAGELNATDVQSRGHRIAGRWVQGIDGHVAELEPRVWRPVEHSDLAIVPTARGSNDAAVLLGRINPIRVLIVGSDVIDLRARLVVPGAPTLPGIERNGSALVA